MSIHNDGLKPNYNNGFETDHKSKVSSKVVLLNPFNVDFITINEVSRIVSNLDNLGLMRACDASTKLERGFCNNYEI